jgi:hypothetical protein
VFFLRKRAQTISEYVILITIIVAFMMSMFTYVKRGTQGLIRAAADMVGYQKNAEQDFSGKGGYVDKSDTTTHSYANQDTITWPGTYLKISREGTDTATQSESNLGFTAEE